MNAAADITDALAHLGHALLVLVVLIVALAVLRTYWAWVAK